MAKTRTININAAQYRHLNWHERRRARMGRRTEQLNLKVHPDWKAHCLTSPRLIGSGRARSSSGPLSSTGSPSRKRPVRPRNAKSPGSSPARSRCPSCAGTVQILRPCPPTMGAAKPRPCGSTWCSGQIGAACRSTHPAPHLMMKGTKASGLRCMQCSHTTQHQGVPRRSCSSVGRGGFLHAGEDDAICASRTAARDGREVRCYGLHLG
jgi:hypothetical protein